MLAQFLLVFREVLEAALITAIVLSYLNRTGRGSLTRFVWYGVIAAASLSIALGIVVWSIYGVLSKAVQVLFEGSSALLAVAVLSWMLYWMAIRGRKLRGEVEKRIEEITTRGAMFALASFSFVVIFREGLETVLFLTPFLPTDPQGTLLGASLGVLVSVAMSYGIFVVGMRIDLQRFFYVTSLLLVFLAGGLAGYGVHELIEYLKLTGIDLGLLGEFAYRLPIPADSIFHHKGVVGSVFAVMFGYTVSAEWARVVVHLGYLAVALPAVLVVYQKR